MRQYTSATVPIAVIAFDFDPLVHFGSSLTVRWQTLALALVVFVCLVALGTMAGRARLRADDLVVLRGDGGDRHALGQRCVAQSRDVV